MLTENTLTSIRCQSIQGSPAYLDHIEAMEGYPEHVDDGEALEWPKEGLAVHLRTIRRQFHRGRETVFWLCGPGLLAALRTDRLSRNPRCPGTNLRSARWNDVDLIDRWCGVMTHRGRGLSEHDQIVIAEMRARAAYLPGLGPSSMSPWLCARASRDRIPPVARQILAFLLRAREMGRGWLDYSNDNFADAIDCHPRSVRRAIAWLEDRALVFRQATSRPAKEGQERPIDQDRNLLVPGPRWMREIDAWAQADADTRSEIAQAGRARHRRRKAARRRSKTVAIEPVTIEEWTDEEIAAREEQQAIIGELRWVEDVEGTDVAAADARDVATGKRTLVEVMEDASGREERRTELVAKIDRIHGRFSREVIQDRRINPSSNWEDNLTARPQGDLNPRTRRNRGPTSRPSMKPNHRRERDTSPPAPTPALSLAAEIAELAGFESRSSRGGDWYDRRYARESDRPRGLSVVQDPGGGSPREIEDRERSRPRASTCPQSAVPETSRVELTPAPSDSQNNDGAVTMPRDPSLSRVCADLLDIVRNRVK